ncbi:MAG: pirin family protein [Deltaproteobacteria bacterium]|nr:pirin family protein [Deltaproteobacteria bacterium]
MRLSRRKALVGSAVLVGCRSELPGPEATPAKAPAVGPNTNPTLVRARRSKDGADADLLRLFPQVPGQHRDPFVLLDDFRVSPPAGFPMHPHRGFEAFTYMLDGSFEHRDTMGNESRVTTGGTQRFTSGSGARHSEMPGQQGVNRGIQLWVNLPRRLKTTAPTYAAVHGRDLPVESRDGAVVRTIVGPGSPVALQTPGDYRDVTLPKDARFEGELLPDWQGLVYVADGAVRVGDVELREGQAGLLVAGAFGLRALADARVIHLAGLPHREPIVHRGPYVD